MPVCRRDLAWLAILPDPRTRLSGPASELIGSTCVILKNDDLPVSRYRFYPATHLAPLIQSYESRSEPIFTSRKSWLTQGLYFTRGTPTSCSFAKRVLSYCAGARSGLIRSAATLQTAFKRQW